MDVTETILLVISSVVLLEVSYLVLGSPRASLKNNKEQAILIDTSVLMDGRIAPVAASGFLQGVVTIPRSVVGELQYLADNADAEKRARARRGLDLISELQQLPGIKVTILQDSSQAKEGVDERLLKLAKKYNAAICTIDYNLNKVAVVEGIKVLNVNELAQSLRMAHLPGEQMLIELIQKGQEQHQAVGYLPDGTMVVVEQASSKIGQMVQVEVVRSLQTAAGKMMFARQIGSAPMQPVKKANQPKPAEKTEKAKTAGRKPNKPQTSEQAKPQAQKHSNERPQKKHHGRNRRVDHEANLLELVDKQQ